MIEVLLPIGYKEGVKVTDKVIANLKRIYPDVKLTTKVEGGHSSIIILNSFKSHDMDYILTKYSPHNIWYYMYDMNWGLKFYNDNKRNLQLITDKDFVGSRFVIPNGMIELSEAKYPQYFPRTGKICIMESNKTERLGMYDKLLQQHELIFDVIGNTMNSNYKHSHNKVSSVPYNSLRYLLSSYSFCFVVWDKYHNKDNLPIKVAECLQSGVLPILDSRFNNKVLPQASNVEEIQHIMDLYSDNELRAHKINYVIWTYKDSVDLDKIRRRAQLIETDWLFIEEIEDVLRWGREKHRGHYWRDNLDVKDFMKALGRHVDAYERGEIYDDETGKSHLIHAACNLMFQRRIDEEQRHN